MRYKNVDILTRHIVAGKQSDTKVWHALGGKLKDYRSILFDKVIAVSYRLSRGWVLAATTRHTKEITTRAINFVEIVDKTTVFFGLRRLQKYGTAAIAKDNTSLSISVVDNRRHDVYAYYQHIFVTATHDKLGTDLQRVQKARASDRKVKTPAVCSTNLGLHQTGCGRQKHIRGDSSKDNQFDIFRRNPGFCAGCKTGLGTEI